MKAGRQTLLATLLVLAACAPPRRVPGTNVDERALDGLWAVDFTLESPLLPGHMPREHSLRGELALLRNPSLARPAVLAGPPTHSGSYSAAFRPFGFNLAADGAPALEARVAPGDSVEIALQPNGQGGVQMRGVLTGDSVAGTWLYEHSRAGMASGRFVMRRIANGTAVGSQHPRPPAAPVPPQD